MPEYYEPLIQQDPCPGLPILDIGEWSLEKHDLLRKYVAASWAARQKWPYRCFIDLFSGPGRVRVRKSNVVTDGGAVVAWRQASEKGGRFTKVIVGDIDPNAVNACKARLEALGAPVDALVGPATQTVDQVLTIANPNGLHLAYLDPYNLEHLPFSVIERLAKFKNIDILVHFSVMDLQRELELDFERDQSRFELFAPDWRNQIDPRSMTKQEARAAFVRYWLSLVDSLGFSCSRERPLMTNSKNGPLYRMMFLMRHKLADKLWSDIAKPPQGSLFN